MNNNDVNDTEIVKCTIDKTKPSIIINEYLKSYGNTLCDNLIEIDNLNDIPDDNPLCICKFNANNIVGGYEMYELTWGHVFDDNSINRNQLHEMNFINNLDSVLDYDTFNLPLMFLFPLLECIRIHNTIKNMYIMGCIPTGIIYVTLHKNDKNDKA